MNVVWLSLGLFFLFMILGVPIAMSIGLAAGASLLAMDTSLVVMAQKMFISTNSFTFFMLVGAIMDRSGITEMLVNFAKACIGWIRYGMVYVTILAGILMGGISGSATADTAALSGILIPTMERQGYPRNFRATAGLRRYAWCHHPTEPVHDRAWQCHEPAGEQAVHRGNHPRLHRRSLHRHHQLLHLPQPGLR